MPPDVILASELEPGRYVCLRTGSVFGRVIRAVTRSQFDHVILVTGPGQCTQATTRGVKTTPLSDFTGALAVANAAEQMSVWQRDAVVRFAMACDGDEYAWPSIFVLGLRALGIKWAWLLRAAADKDAKFCSELAANAGLAAVPQMTGWLCGQHNPALVEPSQMAARDCMVPVAWG